MKTILKSILTVFLALSILPWCPAFADSTDSVTLTINGEFDTDAVRWLVDEINDLRANDAWYWNSTNTSRVTLSDLNPLVYDYALERAAMQRAAELAILYSHTRPNGEPGVSTFAGGTKGENIDCECTSARMVMNEWTAANAYYSGQESRRNMLNSSFKAVGAGYFYANDTQFWVLEFSDRISGAAENPLAAPVTIEARHDYLNGFSFNTTEITLTPSQSIVLSDLDFIYHNAYQRMYSPDIDVICRIDGASFSVANSSVASISGGKLTARAKGQTTLTATAAGFNASVPVKVVDGNSMFRAVVGGSRKLNQETNNLSIQVPAFQGASSYRYGYEMRETGLVDSSESDYPGTFWLDVWASDPTRPVHCTVFAEARDASGKTIGRYTEGAVIYPESEYVMVLPAGLKRLESQALSGTAATCFVIPNGCTAIGTKAFAGSTDLSSVFIPASVTSIASDAFSGSNRVVISAPEGSKALDFARTNGLEYFIVGERAW